MSKRLGLKITEKDILHSIVGVRRRFFESRPFTYIVFISLARAARGCKHVSIAGMQGYEANGRGVALGRGGGAQRSAIFVNDNTVFTCRTAEYGRVAAVNLGRPEFGLVDTTLKNPTSRKRC